MASSDPRVKKLKVQTGVVKRISKEKSMYEKEVEQMIKKVSDLESAGGDEYVVKKQKECLEESRQMVPDAKSRLTKAWDELKNLIAEYQQSGDLDQEAEVLKEAQVQLTNAEDSMK